MSQKADQHKMLPVNIQSLQKLEDWLVANEIDVSQWGSNSAKTIEHLWQEIVEEEVYLQDDPPLRISAIVQIIIRRGTDILIEAEQIFHDGRRRQRDCPPTEKMTPTEDYKEAALRCLQEELGLQSQDIKIVNSTYRTRKEENESPSYPGLRTQYLIHVIDAEVPALPNADFWTIETKHKSKEAVKKHRWIWKRPDKDL